MEVRGMGTNDRETGRLNRDLLTAEDGGQGRCI